MMEYDEDDRALESYQKIAKGMARGPILSCGGIAMIDESPNEFARACPPLVVSSSLTRHGVAHFRRPRQRGLVPPSSSHHLSSRRIHNLRRTSLKNVVDCLRVHQNRRLVSAAVRYHRGALVVRISVRTFSSCGLRAFSKRIIAPIMSSWTSGHFDSSVPQPPRCVV